MRILFLDANEYSRFVMARLFAQHGHQVTLTATAHQARRACVEEDFDAIVCDADLPDARADDLVRDLIDEYGFGAIVVGSGSGSGSGGYGTRNGRNHPQAGSADHGPASRAMIRYVPRRVTVDGLVRAVEEIPRAGLEQRASPFAARPGPPPTTSA